MQNKSESTTATHGWSVQAWCWVKETVHKRVWIKFKHKRLSYGDRSQDCIYLTEGYTWVVALGDF